jgi:hypothetical protein
MTTGCGRPTKGSHPNDDTLPCGTKLYLGADKSNRTESKLLCPKCKETE